MTLSHHEVISANCTPRLGPRRCAPDTWTWCSWRWIFSHLHARAFLYLQRARVCLCVFAWSHQCEVRLSTRRCAPRHLIVIFFFWRFIFSHLRARFYFCNMLEFAIVLCLWCFSFSIFNFPPCTNQNVSLCPSHIDSKSSNHKADQAAKIFHKLPTVAVLTVLSRGNGADNCTQHFSSNMLRVRRAVAQYCEMLLKTHDCEVLRWFSNTFQLRNFTKSLFFLRNIAHYCAKYCEIQRNIAQAISQNLHYCAIRFLSIAQFLRNFSECFTKICVMFRNCYARRAKYFAIVAQFFVRVAQQLRNPKLRKHVNLA